MKNKSYPTIVIIIFIILIILLPLILNEMIFNNSYYSKVSNDGWASFLGGYLGGIATLVALYFTIKDSNNNMQEELRASVRPYLKLLCEENEEQREHFNISIYYPDRKYEKYDSFIKTKLGFVNIGTGPALNIVLKECSLCGLKQSFFKANNTNIVLGANEESDCSFTMNIGFTSEYSKEMLAKSYAVDGGNINESSLVVVFGYEDIYGKEYTQNITFKIHILTTTKGEIVSTMLIGFIYNGQVVD